MASNNNHHVVIIGGGFGGLYAANYLTKSSAQITLVDKRNFHLFQPLLYQVATGGLSPGDIAYPLRGIFNRYKNVSVKQAEVIDIEPVKKQIILKDGVLRYDTLIVATGVSHHYFGREDWAETAPGLKTIENALDIRRRILLAFEAAERETDPDIRRAWMNFVIVGAGPTGVELAGALAELAHKTLTGDFRHIDPADINIFLLEGTDRVLPPYPAELSEKAKKSLLKLGVTVRTKSLVTEIEGDRVIVREADATEVIRAKTVLWAAGMKASAMGQVLANRTGAELDRAGRVIVEPDLSLKGQPDIFVVGDLANYPHHDGQPLPGIAPVAMQEGRYVAEVIKRRLAGQPAQPFKYLDKGSLAVIGRNSAVAYVKSLKFSGYFAWLLWVFIHIWYLIGYDNKFIVMIQWTWNYLTWNRGARLITGPDPFPLVSAGEQEGTEARQETGPSKKQNEPLAV